MIQCGGTLPEMTTLKNAWPIELPVWTNAERLGGTPCFRNTRVPIDAIFANLQDGVSLDEFLDAFDGVKREDAIAVLEYARTLFTKEAGSF